MGRIVLPVYTPYYIPNGNEVAVIETSRGTIRVQLAGKDAPVTAGNFIELAARGFYDKLKFHAHPSRHRRRALHHRGRVGDQPEQQARAGKPLHGAQVRAELG